MNVSTVCCSMGQPLGQSTEMGTHPSMWPGDMESQEPSAEQVCGCVGVWGVGMWVCGVCGWVGRCVQCRWRAVQAYAVWGCVGMVLR